MVNVPLPAKKAMTNCTDSEQTASEEAGSSSFAISKSILCILALKTNTLSENRMINYWKF